MVKCSLSAVLYLAICCITLLSCAPLTLAEDLAEESVKGMSEAPEEDEESPLEIYFRLKRLREKEQVVLPPYVAVLPFVDESGFRKDIWDLGWEMARLLSQEAAGSAKWHVVPYDVVDELLGNRRVLSMEELVELGQQVEADILFLGTIDDYDLKRLSVGDPMLGGYKSYIGVAKMRLGAMRVQDQNDLGMVSSEQEASDRDLGLDLLGKPRDQDVKFAELRNIEFASIDFRESLLGKATLAALEEVISGMESLFEPEDLKLDGQMPEVLSVYGEDVYINIGSENGLRVGYRFAVFPGFGRVEEGGSEARRRLGIVEVREIIGARLSSVRILDGVGQIRAGDRLSALVQESEPVQPE